ncbi:hypothetical protein F4780DRAFT_488702 [Xylariomycetidae sp. FL0641]|nr:hypothetical protein F4780DRAFT_488702 [Xylariomycetidae sp. FL0641]
MKKTLLLCFIHGFKGGDDTFGANSEFALHLEALVSASLPRAHVRAITYPTYETRGDLGECVARFRDWLLEQVIDLEVAAGAPSPTVDPSVRVVLVGHSMGGIVAAETAIGLAGEKPIVRQQGADGGGGGGGGDDDSSTLFDATEDDDGDDEKDNDNKKKKKKEKDADDDDALNSLMFPYIQGVLAFDTPFLGIAPGVVAHGAEGQYNAASAALTQLSGLTSMFWGGGSSEQPPAQSAAAAAAARKAALPPPPPAGIDSSSTSSQKPQQNNKNNGNGGWGSWGRMAMYAGGAAAAVAAGGAAAYLHRERITGGWAWAGSHLEFVGCLARGEELRARVRALARLRRELGVGFANLYTRLGAAAAAAPRQVSMVGTVMGAQRTFCNVPRKLLAAGPDAAGVWREAVNDKAKDETGAHMSMFEPKENPGYHQLSEDAKNLIVSWSQNEWYESSTAGELEE